MTIGQTRAFPWSVTFGRSAWRRVRAVAQVAPVILATSVLSVSTAEAETVTVEGDTVVVRGDAGERNSVTASRVDGIRISDPSATLVAGAGCTEEGWQAVVCQGARLSVLTGDSDDSVTLEGSLSAQVDGGSGDDKIVGSAAGDVLRGGWGADVLDGGDGNDTIDGGDGMDRIDGGLGADRMDGGSGGSDYLYYSQRQVGVVVDFTNPGVSGEPGEGDDVAGFESVDLGSGDDRFRGAGETAQVQGNGGDDVLVGGPAADALDGGLGDDRVSGEGGDDQLYGGGDKLYVDGRSKIVPGNDHLDGGPGNDSLFEHFGHDELIGGSGDDYIRSADFFTTNLSPILPVGKGDSVSCGAGHDAVHADYYDALALDCEANLEGTPAWRSVRPDRRGSIGLKVRCAWAYSRPCRGTMRLLGARRGRPPSTGSPWRFTQTEAPPPGCLRARPDVLGRGTLDVRAGRVNRARVALNESGRRLLRGRACVLARVAIAVTEPSGRQLQFTRTVSLRRP